jgi:hypothetical protein
VRRVGGERHRIRVGDAGRHDPLGGRLPHLDTEAIPPAEPFALAGDRPDAGDVVPVHRQEPWFVAGLAEELELDRAGGGCPDREPWRPVAVDHRAELGVGGVGVEVVEDTGNLHRGQRHHLAGGVPPGDQQPVTQQVAQGRVTQLTDRVRPVRAQVREAAALALEEPAGPGHQRQGAEGELGGADGEPLGQRHGGPVEEDGVGPGRVEFRPERPEIGTDRCPRPGGEPHLTADGEVESLVVGEILLLAVVQHVAQADGVGPDPDLEDRAEVVEAGGHVWFAPTGLLRDRDALPAVQAPPGVITGRSPVMDDHRVGGDLRQVGRDGRDAAVTGGDPDLTDLTESDPAVDLDVLGTLPVEHQEADLPRGLRDRHPGEPAPRVLAVERDAVGIDQIGAGREIAPGVQDPVGVIAV